MIDGYGREIDYIRISVTDRCSLRCIYCMPEEGIKAVSQDEILRYDEIVRLAGVFAACGIRSIKLTGGEPLVRNGIEELAADLKKISGIEQVTLTTNGVRLAAKMAALSDAGIDGVNISLDTLNPQVYSQITGSSSIDQVLEGFQAALCYPQIPLKLNCVLMGIPGQDVLALAELAKQYPVHVRYIEMMPIGPGKKFCLNNREKCLYGLEEMWTEKSLLQALCSRYGVCEPYSRVPGSGPSHYYSFEGFLGKIGFISAVSHKFCHNCNRIRLTSEGYLKTCLQYDFGTDLRGLLRGGASDKELRLAVETAILKKPAGHQFERELGERKPESARASEKGAADMGGPLYETRTMAQIGG